MGFTGQGTLRVSDLHVHCRWEDYVRRSEDRSDTEALLRSIPDVIGEEDRDLNRVIDDLYSRAKEDRNSDKERKMLN
jgi:hypothetical protein